MQTHFVLPVVAVNNAFRVYFPVDHQNPWPLL